MTKTTMFLAGVLVGVALLAIPADGADIDAAIRVETEKITAQLIETRRTFHQHPELSNREVQTAAEIAKRLREYGWSVQTGVAKNGVVANLTGALPGPLVALRADIDALPITELLDVPYRSQNPGVMHACGHDVHITVALGTAAVLAKLKDRLHGTVRLLFQPAEEGAPGSEEGGATLMIKEGALDNPVPAALFGLHVMPDLHVGQVGFRSGGIMAAGDSFKITVHGVMTHGSAPNKGVDAVYIAAQVVNALQSIVSRENDPRSPLVISVGSITAGNRSNIIADTATLVGTVRTVDVATRTMAQGAMERVMNGTCQAFRATCELKYNDGNPATINDAALARYAAPILQRALGETNAVEVLPVMAAEDFAYYREKLPTYYFFLGVGNPEKGITSYLHSSTFQADEDSLAVGVRATTSLIMHFYEKAK